MIKKTWKDLKDFIQLEVRLFEKPYSKLVWMSNFKIINFKCDNVNYTDVIRNKGYHFILFLNIPK